MKYPKPNILLIDLPDECYKTLNQKGFNVTTSTFGHPYKAKKTGQYDFIYVDSDLKNIREQEIIFIDLETKEPLDKKSERKATEDLDTDVMVKHSFDTVDPRPLIMTINEKDFSTILRHGGVFVIFADSFQQQEFGVFKKNSYGRFEKREDPILNLWSFLDILSSSNIKVENNSGREIKVSDENSFLGRIFNKYLKDAHYTITLDKTPYLGQYFVPLLLNKYGEAVGVGINLSRGYIFILPQFKDKQGLILDFLNNILPEIYPEKFPFFEGSHWSEKSEYEFESVKALRDEKAKVAMEFNTAIEKLDDQISEEKKKYGHLVNILTKSGDELVKSVEEVLKMIGFNNVINMDDKLATTDPSAPKQEDLQILDTSPSLLMEVKGINSLPREDDTFQVVKYINRRTKEWKRTDINGVVLVNHQRNLPPLAREKEPFTEQQITDAKHNDFTLIPTWDLVQLIKGMIKYGWNAENIRKGFYQKGRMTKVPAHYVPIGFIENYWEKNGAVGIKIDDNCLSLGDRIGYVLENDYLEEDVTSLQCKNNAVDVVNVGELAGIKTIYSKDQLEKGVRVYKIVDIYSVKL